MQSVDELRDGFPEFIRSHVNGVVDAEGDDHVAPVGQEERPEALDPAPAPGRRRLRSRTIDHGQ